MVLDGINPLAIPSKHTSSIIFDATTYILFDQESMTSLSGCLRSIFSYREAWQSE
jgi:hypothetical protein